MRSVTINGNTFYNGDCVAGAAEHIPDDAVDLIITDPPYGIDGDRLHRHYNRDEEFVVEGYVEVPADEYGEFSRAWIQQAERILRPGGSLYVVSGYTNLYHILAALRETELTEVNHIIWHYNFGVYTRRKCLLPTTSSTTKSRGPADVQPRVPVRHRRAGTGRRIAQLPRPGGCLDHQPGVRRAGSEQTADRTPGKDDAVAATRGWSAICSSAVSRLPESPSA